MNENHANFRKTWIIYSCLLNWNGCLRFVCSLLWVLQPQVPINHEHKPKENSCCNNPTTQNNQTTHFHPTHHPKKIRHTNIHLLNGYVYPIIPYLFVYQWWYDIPMMIVYLFTSDRHLSPKTPTSGTSSRSQVSKRGLPRLFVCVEGRAVDTLPPFFLEISPSFPVSMGTIEDWTVFNVEMYHGTGTYT